MINPEISSGLPLPDVHRYPPPGSRPELQATAATKGMSKESFKQSHEVLRAFPNQRLTLLRTLCVLAKCVIILAD